ncbi:MAG: hypothetical protein RMK92_10145, partial [Armatimonadota bacterium]|nr:hypothetical protein [Armatimonadota bacterium]
YVAIPTLHYIRWEAPAKHYWNASPRVEEGEQFGESHDLYWGAWEVMPSRQPSNTPPCLRARREKDRLPLPAGGRQGGG